MASGRKRRTCALSPSPKIGPVRIRPAAMRLALPQTVLGLSLKNEADSTFSQVVPQTEPAFQVQPRLRYAEDPRPCLLGPAGAGVFTGNGGYSGRCRGIPESGDALNWGFFGRCRPSTGGCRREPPFPVKTAGPARSARLFESEDAPGGVGRPEEEAHSPQVDQNKARPAPIGTGQSGTGRLRESEGRPWRSRSAQARTTRPPQVDHNTAKPAPQREPANAVQVACAKARARLARRIGPKEEAIDLVVMADD